MEPNRYPVSDVCSTQLLDMGKSNLARRRMPPSRDGKRLASIIRSNNNEKKLTDEEELDRLVKEPPTIGVVLSGGGWRSMEASTNFMDTLRLSGVLSHVSVVAGLSGGSWTCVLGGMSGEKNYLYEGGEQVWAKSRNDCIVSDIDTLLKGDADTQDMLTALKRMLSVQRAEKAVKATGWGSWRWSDGIHVLGSVVAKVTADKHMSHLMKLLAADQNQAYLYNYSRILNTQFYGPGDGKDVQFCQVKSGDAGKDEDKLPLMVVAATSFARFPEPPKHKHDWFEFDAVTTFIDTPNNGMIQTQSVVGGGLIECNGKSHRMSLHSLRIRFYERVRMKDHFYKLTAPIIMAIGGCAAYDIGRKAMKALKLDKDGFLGYIFEENTSSSSEPLDDPIGHAQLFDAGISCNVPIPLVNGRCNIAFVLDNSHNEKASEELAVAVCKGFYHIHVPGEIIKQNDVGTSTLDEDNLTKEEKLEGLLKAHKVHSPVEAAFLQNHVHKWMSTDGKNESTDVVRIFLPKKGYSKAVWGEKNKGSRKGDEPILIYLRGLRTESTFRMDRSPQEIEDNHINMTKITAIGIKALEFIIKQPHDIPTAGYWTQDEILPDYPLLRETVAQPLAPPRSLVNKVFSLLTIIHPKFVYNIVATQINKLNTTTKSHWNRGIKLMSFDMGGSTANRTASPLKLAGTRPKISSIACSISDTDAETPREDEDTADIDADQCEATNHVRKNSVSSIMNKYTPLFEEEGSSCCSDPSFRWCVEALAWLLESLKAMKKAEEEKNRVLTRKDNLGEVVRFPPNVFNPGEKELMQFKCLAASLSADEDLLREFGYLTALLRKYLQIKHLVRRNPQNTDDLEKRLEEIVKWADELELKITKKEKEKTESTEASRKKRYKDITDKIIEAKDQMLKNDDVDPPRRRHVHRREKGADESGVGGST